MKTNRRQFIVKSSAAAAALAVPTWLDKVKAGNPPMPATEKLPLVISTWNHGYEANGLEDIGERWFGP